MPVQRGGCSPERWLRTATNAEIGSSTSMTARSSLIEGRLWLKWGPTIAAEAGELRKSLAYRSLSIKVISPGPASATGRAERIETLPSPTRRPRTKAASCSTVATTGDFLSSLKGADMDQASTPRESTPVQPG